MLISAVAFDLVEEAAGISSGQDAVAWGLFLGCGGRPRYPGLTTTVRGTLAVGITPFG